MTAVAMIARKCWDWEILWKIWRRMNITKDSPFYQILIPVLSWRRMEDQLDTIAVPESGKCYLLFKLTTTHLFINWIYQLFILEEWLRRQDWDRDASGTSDEYKVSQGVLEDHHGAVLRALQLPANHCESVHHPWATEARATAPWYHAGPHPLQEVGAGCLRDPHHGLHYHRSFLCCLPQI